MPARDSGEILIGRKFGNLTVAGEEPRKHGHRYLRCLCDCGKVTFAYVGHLRMGAKRSCGCAKREPDLTGMKFERLTVLQRVRRPDQRGHYWKCRCDCGKITFTRGNNLRQRNAVSCGCKRKWPKGEAVLGAYFRRYKREAQKRQLAWHLSFDDFRRMTKQECHYCGTKPRRIAAKMTIDHQHNGHCRANGIDRKNNNEGYTKKNVVPCCTICNKMKMALSYRQFLKRVEAIHAHRANSN